MHTIHRHTSPRRVSCSTTALSARHTTTMIAAPAAHAAAGIRRSSSASSIAPVVALRHVQGGPYDGRGAYICNRGSQGTRLRAASVHSMQLPTTATPITAITAITESSSTISCGSSSTIYVPTRGLAGGPRLSGPAAPAHDEEAGKEVQRAAIRSAFQLGPVAKRVTASEQAVSEAKLQRNAAEEDVGGQDMDLPAGIKQPGSNKTTTRAAKRKTAPVTAVDSAVENSNLLRIIEEGISLNTGKRGRAVRRARGDAKSTSAAKEMSSVAGSGTANGGEVGNQVELNENVQEELQEEVDTQMKSKTKTKKKVKSENDDEEATPSKASGTSSSKNNKIYNFIATLQEKYPNDVIFVQVGSFYEIYDIGNKYFDKVAQVLALKIIQPTDKRSYRYTGFPIRVISSPMMTVPMNETSGLLDGQPSNPMDENASASQSLASSSASPSSSTSSSSSSSTTTLNVYLERLLSSMDTRIIIVDQSQPDPTNLKIIDRSVVRIVSPGTLLESQMLLNQDSKYLATIAVEDDEKSISQRGKSRATKVAEDGSAGASTTFTMSWIDVSLGTLSTTIGDIDHIKRQVSLIQPAEILFDSSIYKDENEVELKGSHINGRLDLDLDMGAQEKDCDYGNDGRRLDFQSWLSMDEKDSLSMLRKQYYSRTIKLEDKGSDLGDSGRKSTSKLVLDTVLPDESVEDAPLDSNGSSGVPSSSNETTIEETNVMNDTTDKSAVLILQYLREAFPRQKNLRIHIDPYSRNLTNSNSKQLQQHLQRRRNVMILNDTAQQSLEIMKPLNSRSMKHSLMGVLNRTATAGGRRLLSSRLLEPSMDVSLIRRRHNLVELLVKNEQILSFLSLNLKSIGDLDRMLQRIECCIVDFDMYEQMRLGIISSLNVLKGLSTRFKEVQVYMVPTVDLTRMIALAEEALDSLPQVINYDENDGNRKFITKGIYSKYDIINDKYESLTKQIEYLRNEILNTEGLENPDNDMNSNWDLAFTVDVRTQRPICILRSGSLKARKFIQKKLELLPLNSLTILSDTKTSVKFIYQPWTKLYSNIQTIQNQLYLIEKEFLDLLQSKVSNVSNEIRLVSACISSLDVSSSMSQTAVTYGYVKPEMTTDDLVHDVKGGRHPVVETAQLSRGIEYQTTDYKLGGKSSPRMILLTGPNMGGKSTLLRQAALISIMAQSGGFVPADRAKLSVVDKILVRIGASDDLASHRSTFMVEMSETARILKMATEKSLVIIDELGRGTSTRDGISIAYAVLKHLHDKSKCRGIFATHYRELARLVQDKQQQGQVGGEAEEAAERDVMDTKFENVGCFKTEVIDVASESSSSIGSSQYDLGQILCTYKLVPGIMDSSYGIHVARAAGIPMDVVHTAARASTAIFGKK